MQLITGEIAGYLKNSSMIRRMFEAGIELRKKYGADQVYDFSLGNPDLPAPPAVKQSLQEIAGHAGDAFAFGYMPNAGYPATRARVAELVSREQGLEVPASHVLMTCGAAGGINVFFRAVLERGDEVMVAAPYFVEYGFYAGNFGGRLVPVPAKPLSFELDIPAMERAVTPRTRAVIVNSPNNPTGQIYSRAELAGLAAMLERKSREFGRAIFLVSDEPYRMLNFDGAEIPSVFDLYAASAVIGSFSKSLSLAGERLGYIAVNPALEGCEELLAALNLTNRILGFVNAPAIAQKIVEAAWSSGVDLDIYRRRRQAMASALDGAKIEYAMPKGAFYFFPKSPVADESRFVDALFAERVLAVPGSGFGCPGYVRLAFCVDAAVIEAAAPGIARAAALVRGK